MKLQGKVAIVTGGGTGIGRAIAEAFASAGASVVISGRRLTKLHEALEGIRLNGGEALAVQADVRHESDNQRLLEQTIKTYGQLNILVNNAGHYFAGTLTETAVDDWDRMFDINVRGVFLVCRVAIPLIERSGGGSIINISSTLGQQVIPGYAAYCASKAALDMLTQSIALDYAAQGIRVNSISPGIVDTPIHEARKLQDRAGWEKLAAGMHPLGRMGQPSDVAAAALYLASDEAAWVTGTNLIVDGGIHLA